MLQADSHLVIEIDVSSRESVCALLSRMQHDVLKLDLRHAWLRFPSVRFSQLFFGEKRTIVDRVARSLSEDQRVVDFRCAHAVYLEAISSSSSSFLLVNGWRNK